MLFFFFLNIQTYISSRKICHFFVWLVLICKFLLLKNLNILALTQKLLEVLYTQRCRDEI